MARLVYALHMSLDGFVDHMAFAPDPEPSRDRAHRTKSPSPSRASPDPPLPQKWGRGGALTSEPLLLSPTCGGEVAREA
jgi:hypothetical protein